MSRISDVLGEVVCTRRLVAKPPAEGRAVLVRIGKPRRQRRSWICPFHISGIGLDEPALAYGEDAVQALIMALQGIRATLLKTDSQFTWLGGEEGDAGFPMLINGGMDLSFTRQLEALVEAKKENYWKKAASRP